MARGYKRELEVFVALGIDSKPVRPGLDPLPKELPPQGPAERLPTPFLTAFSPPYPENIRPPAQPCFCFQSAFQRA